MRIQPLPVLGTLLLGTVALTTVTIGGGITTSDVDLPHTFSSGTPAVAAATAVKTAFPNHEVCGHHARGGDQEHRTWAPRCDKLKQ